MATDVPRARPLLTAGMSQTFGRETPPPHVHAQQPHEPARWLVLIDSAGSDMRLARLYADPQQPAVAEFDAGAPEVQQMTRGLAAQRTAGDASWDRALSGHSSAERAAAEVYALDI